MNDVDAVVIGAGPAGLMAADCLSAAGHRVVMAERMPSVARKFLMAGKSGLNLTRVEPAPAFRDAYGTSPLRGIVDQFGAAEVMRWAESLGQPLFTGSTGRVFPVAMKASPLLRAWLARLNAADVRIRTRWRWTGVDGPDLTFDTLDGPRRLAPRVTILALGGASWRRLGSDGEWVPSIRAMGVPVADFAPANAGIAVAWSPHMAPHFGRPVKTAALTAGDVSSRGEFVVSERGLEGGGIYAVSRPVRDGAALTIDLLPGRDPAWISARLARARGSIGNRLRKGLRLDPVRAALLLEFARPLPDDPAGIIKALPVVHRGLRPLDEAISSAGGIAWDGLDDGLMLRARPGTFACGEMLDWEAPTGGYLLTACLATGRHAGRAAAAHLSADR